MPCVHSFPYFISVGPPSKMAARGTPREHTLQGFASGTVPLGAQQWETVQRSGFALHDPMLKTSSKICNISRSMTDDCEVGWSQPSLAPLFREAAAVFVFVQYPPVTTAPYTQWTHATYAGCLGDCSIALRVTAELKRTRRKSIVRRHSYRNGTVALSNSRLKP